MTISFINTEGQVLFAIPDGGSIKITLPDRTELVKKCEYVDNYRARIGKRIYHLGDFARITSDNGYICGPVETT